MKEKERWREALENKLMECSKTTRTVLFHIDGIKAPRSERFHPAGSIGQ